MRLLIVTLLLAISYAQTGGWHIAHQFKYGTSDCSGDPFNWKYNYAVFELGSCVEVGLGNDYAIFQEKNGEYSATAYGTDSTCTTPDADPEAGLMQNGDISCWPDSNAEINFWTLEIRYVGPYLSSIDVYATTDCPGDPIANFGVHGLESGDIGSCIPLGYMRNSVQPPNYGIYSCNGFSLELEYCSTFSDCSSCLPGTLSEISSECPSTASYTKLNTDGDIICKCKPWCKHREGGPCTYCAHENCSGCSECAAEDKCDDVGGACAPWCLTNSQQWGFKCQWNGCSGCNFCVCAPWCDSADECKYEKCARCEICQ